MADILRLKPLPPAPFVITGGKYLVANGTPNLQKSTQMEVLSGAWKVLEALDGILGGSCGLIAALGVLMGAPSAQTLQNPSVFKGFWRIQGGPGHPQQTRGCQVGSLSPQCRKHWDKSIPPANENTGVTKVG